MLNCKNTIIVFMLFAFFTAATSMAAESGSLNYVLLFDFTYKGELLKKGLYEIEWEIMEQDAKMTFKPVGKTGNVVVKGKVEHALNEYAATNILYKKDSSGQRIISQFEIGGKKFRIVFE